MDPLSLVMFALIGVLIFFMFRNGKKRQQAQIEMQNNLRPGAEVMLQSGIFGIVESVDDENNRVTLLSGTTTIVAHRNAVGQIVTPVEDAAEHENEELAPDDDPEFGERVKGHESAADAEASAEAEAEAEAEAGADADAEPSDSENGESKA